MHLTGNRTEGRRNHIQILRRGADHQNTFPLIIYISLPGVLRITDIEIHTGRFKKLTYRRLLPRISPGQIVGRTV